MWYLRHQFFTKLRLKHFKCINSFTRFSHYTSKIRFCVFFNCSEKWWYEKVLSIHSKYLLMQRLQTKVNTSKIGTYKKERVWLLSIQKIIMLTCADSKCNRNYPMPQFRKRIIKWKHQNIQFTNEQKNCHFSHVLRTYWIIQYDL